MTAPDPLQECLLGLHAALGESVPLIIAGGYGLYLKQRLIVHSGLGDDRIARLHDEFR